MFFVFAGLEAVVAQGGLKASNAFFHPLRTYFQMRDIRRQIRRGDAAMDGIIYDLHRAGVDLSEHNLTDGATSVMDKWADKQVDRVRRYTGSDKIASSSRMGFDILSGRWLSRKIMGDFFPTIKLWGAMQMVDAMQEEMPGVSIEQIRRYAAPNINNAFGGQMWVDYPAVTPKLLKWLNLSMFAPTWTVSAWNVAGGQKITGHLFDNYLSLPGERFVFMRNWPAMYVFALQAVPHLLQAGIMAVSKMLPDDDEFRDVERDDQWFAWANERDKGGLFPSIDVTPLVRRLPFFKGGRTGKRRAYIRFGKQSYEVINGWMTQPTTTFLRKTSMPVKLVWEQLLSHSPGSPDFALPFAKRGMAGFFAGDVKGGAALKFWNSRLGIAGQKFIPLSWAQLSKGDADTILLSGVAPVSRGTSETKVIEGMSRVLETYAEASSFGRLKTSAAVRANLERATWGYLDALEKNGYNPDLVLKSARGVVMRKYYAEFFDAFDSGDERRAEAAAKSLARLGGTSANLASSMANRYRRQKRRGMTDQERQAAIEAFEGVVMPFGQ